MFSDVKDWIGDDLPGAVVSDIAAAISGNDFNSLGLVPVLRVK